MRALVSAFDLNRAFLAGMWEGWRLGGFVIGCPVYIGVLIYFAVCDGALLSLPLAFVISLGWAHLIRHPREQPSPDEEVVFWTHPLPLLRP